MVRDGDTPEVLLLFSVLFTILGVCLFGKEWGPWKSWGKACDLEVDRISTRKPTETINLDPSVSQGLNYQQKSIYMDWT